LIPRPDRVPDFPDPPQALEFAGTLPRPPKDRLPSAEAVEDNDLIRREMADEQVTVCSREYAPRLTSAYIRELEVLLAEVIWSSGVVSAIVGTRGCADVSEAETAKAAKIKRAALILEAERLHPHRGPWIGCFAFASRPDDSLASRPSGRAFRRKPIAQRPRAVSATLSAR
jgi:hypothetical protein